MTRVRLLSPLDMHLHLREGEMLQTVTPLSVQAFAGAVIMQELGIPLLVHGETHGFVLDREREFLAVYDQLATHFPRLTIVMEHITTREADRHMQVDVVLAGRPGGKPQSSFSTGAQFP